MNTTVISGRLVRNPGYNEVENEKGLHKIAKFVLAVRRNYSDEVSFIPVKAFAKKAEFARDYLMQGTKVMVEGEIVTGNYEDKDTGKKIYTTEVYANRIEFAGAKMVDRPPFPEDAEGFLEIPGHMKNADGSINNKNVVLSAACEAAELFQCMMSVNQKLEDWQRFNHTLEMHLRSVECEKIHDICQAVYGMKHPSNELEGLYLAREDEQICLLYYQVFVGMLEINITSAEVLYKQKEETINE